jgi:methionine-S-sulfoxide reductase
VGYTGGDKKDPTYYNLGDHTETLQLDFDPQQISYADLLEVFWKSHNPCDRPGSRQYMSAIFYHDEAQKKAALATRDREAAKRRSPITTAILPAKEFYLAEDYHQKYQLRQRSDLMREFRAMFPEEKDFVASTAAARVNGYLGGNGSPETLEKESAGLGLSAAATKKLIDLVKRGQ